MLMIACFPVMAGKGKWKVLFDGKSAAAWRGYKQEGFPDKAWKIEAGTFRTIIGSETRDLITKEVVHNMRSCMACHAATKARNDCITCHEEH